MLELQNPWLNDQDSFQQFYRTSVSRNKVNDLHLCLLNSGLKFLDKASFSHATFRTFLSRPGILYMLSVFQSPQGTKSARISLHYIFPINVSSSYFSLNWKAILKNNSFPLLWYCYTWSIHFLKSTCISLILKLLFFFI